MYLSVQCGVGVVWWGQVVLLGQAVHFLHQGDDRLEFLVCLTQSGLELLMGVNQTLKTAKLTLKSTEPFY